MLSSRRLFSEGGDFAPEEVKLFQKRLKEESKEIIVTEESIFSDLEAFLSSSLQQVRQVLFMWTRQTRHLLNPGAPPAGEGGDGRSGGETPRPQV